MVTEEDRLAEALYFANRCHNRKHKTGCVLYSKNGEFLGGGWAHDGEWSYGGLYSVHAEVHAVLRARKKHNLKGSTAYVATYASRSGIPTLSKPCLNCATTLVGYGIDSVIYTTSNVDLPYSYLYLPGAIEKKNLKVYKKRGKWKQ